MELCGKHVNAPLLAWPGLLGDRCTAATRISAASLLQPCVVADAVVAAQDSESVLVGIKMYTNEQLHAQKKSIAKMIGERCLSCRYELDATIEELENVAEANRATDAYGAIMSKLAERHKVHDISPRAGLDGQPRRIKRRFSPKSMGRLRPRRR